MDQHKPDVKGDEITIDQARATIKNFTRLAMHSRELVARSAALLEKSGTLCAVNPETNILKSLKIDLKVGLTFAVIAVQRPNDRQRNQRNARVAYDTVLRQLARMHLSNTDKAEVQSRAGELRTALQQLGEAV